ncbi:ATP-binding protein [Streptomyces sp. NPDC047108]|uniref:ATP-binding protein n=1 Tax=Streptomyces sp. NPDC047108 TaxID=3155025 RepID=UPI003409DFFB
MAQAQWTIPCGACCVDLAARHEPARHARSALHRYLTTTGTGPGDAPAPPELIDAALLIADELVTNACRHGDGALTMLMSWESGALVIEVDDAGTEPPTPVPEELRGESGGFGMQIVTSLADDWSVHRTARGKTVRARLRFPDHHGSVPWQGPDEESRDRPEGSQPTVPEQAAAEPVPPDTTTHAVPAGPAAVPSDRLGPAGIR